LSQKRLQAQCRETAGGFLISTTRNTGVLIIIPLFVEFLQDKNSISDIAADLLIELKIPFIVAPQASHRQILTS